MEEENVTSNTTNLNVTGHTIQINSISQLGKKPEQWLNALQELKEIDNGARRRKILQHFFMQSSKNLDSTELRHDKYFANLLAEEALFYGEVDADDARSTFQLALTICQKSSFLYIKFAQFELDQGRKHKALKILGHGEVCVEDPTEIKAVKERVEKGCVRIDGSVGNRKNKPSPLHNITNTSPSIDNEVETKKTTSINKRVIHPQTAPVSKPPASEVVHPVMAPPLAKEPPRRVPSPTPLPVHNTPPQRNSFKDLLEIDLKSPASPNLSYFSSKKRKPLSTSNLVLSTSKQLTRNNSQSSSESQTTDIGLNKSEEIRSVKKNSLAQSIGMSGQKAIRVPAPRVHQPPRRVLISESRRRSWDSDDESDKEKKQSRNSLDAEQEPEQETLPCDATPISDVFEARLPSPPLIQPDSATKKPTMSSDEKENRPHPTYGTEIGPTKNKEPLPIPPFTHQYEATGLSSEIRSLKLGSEAPSTRFKYPPHPISTTPNNPHVQPPKPNSDNGGHPIPIQPKTNIHINNLTPANDIHHPAPLHSNPTQNPNYPNMPHSKPPIRPQSSYQYVAHAPHYPNPPQMYNNPIQKTTQEKKINGISYLVLRVLGKGGSSKVYQVFNPLTSQISAVKQVNLNGCEQSVLEGYKSEIDFLKKLQGCRYIIKLRDYEIRESCLLLVMECGSIDLSGYLKKQRSEGNGLQILDIMVFWKNMLSGVEAIHKQGVMHLDLKPANFMFVDNTLKLIDFGIANSIQVDATSIIKDTQFGTLNYMAPETINDMSNGGQHGMNPAPKFKVGPKADVWSLGCILYYMMYGKTPFQHIHHQAMKLLAITNERHRIEFPDFPRKEFIEIVQSCLIRDPKKRPSVEMLLNHPMLKPFTVYVP